MYGFFIVLLFSLIILNYKPITIKNNINNKYKNSVTRKNLDNIYSSNFELKNFKNKKPKIFMPKFDINTLEEADFFATLFNLKNHVDTEDYFKYSNKQESLKVFKYINLITYEKNNKDKNYNKDIINKDESISLLIDFMEERFLPITYSDIIVDDKKNDIYEIKFLSEIDGINNHAFNTSGVVSSFGEILNLNYFYLDLQKIDICNIKSIDEAYLELPVDSLNNLKIDIQEVDLVYIYENSIIQPAYYFKGKKPDGELFEHYVKASLYK